jgi:hypothetical protein
MKNKEGFAKADAIKILNSLINKLPKEINREDKSIESESADYALKYLGPNSHLYKSMANFSFTNTYYQSTVRERYISLINSIIGFININGLYKEPKRNFLQNLSNEWILSGLGGLLVICVTIGYYFGTQKFDKEAFKSLETISNYKDSISFFKSRIFSDSIKYNTQQPYNADTTKK